MHVCLLTPQFPPHSIDGGVGHYVHTLARGLCEAGHQVTVCGFGIHTTGTIDRPWGRSVSLAVPSSFQRGLWPMLLGGVNKLTPRTATGARDVLASVMHDEWRRAASRVLFSWACSEGPFDIIEAPNTGAYTAAFPADRPWPVVVRLSSPASECGPSPGNETNWEAKACAVADLVVGNTSVNLAHCRSAYGLALEPAEVILHGIDDVASQGATRSDSELRFLTLARVDSRKGLDILAEAITDVLPKQPHCSFDLVGTTRAQFDEAFPELSERLARSVPNAVDRVRFHGKVSEAEKLYHYEASHYLLVPSRYESFCLVAVEALRAGTPFVAAAVGGLREVAAHARSSLLIPNNTVEEWRTMLLQLAAHGPHRAEQLRGQARVEYEQQFCARRMIDETLRVYGSLLRTRFSAVRQG